MISSPIDGLTLNIPDSNKPRVVVIGAGFGGLNTVHQLKQQKLPGGSAR